MFADYWLSVLHFVLAFLLVAILTAQWALIRPGMSALSLQLAAKLDRSYGLAAMLLLVIGITRVFLGAKAASFYLSNPLFWGKIVLFGLVALLSIPTTIQLIRWSRQSRTQASYAPPEDEVRRIQRWLRWEAVALALIPFFAAAMARGFGHG